MESYKLTKIVLGGIYGARVGLNDEEVIAAFQNICSMRSSVKISRLNSIRLFLMNLYHG